VRGKSSLSVSVKELALKEKVCGSVCAIGIPAAIGSILMSVSQIIINSQLAKYDDMAVAGMGVAMKVITITGMVCMGLGQGVQPLLGYCVGAKLWERFKKAFRFSMLFSLALGAVLTIICYLFTNQIVSAFLSDPAAYSYAVEFSRILLTTSFLFGVFFVLVNTLQAMGAAKPALIINLSRQGIIFIPALFILQVVVGINGLIWAQPVADVLSIGLATILYLRVSRKMMFQKERRHKCMEDESVIFDDTTITGR
jgi:Na+-driven multidrug efflux pump